MKYFSVYVSPGTEYPQSLTTIGFQQGLVGINNDRVLNSFHEGNQRCQKWVDPTKETGHITSVVTHRGRSE